MAWKKPFFKRVSSKISARMLNLMTLPLQGEKDRVRGNWLRIYRAVCLEPNSLQPKQPKWGIFRLAGREIEAICTENLSEKSVCSQCGCSRAETFRTASSLPLR
jgi:hypothetical protein